MAASVSIALRTPTLPPAQHTNCYLVGRRDAVVIDPGAGQQGELERLRQLLWRHRGTGGGIQLVVVTHHHRDHVGGAAAVADELGVPLAGHPETLDRLPQTARQLRRLLEGDRLEVDPGVPLQVLYTPGHAPGHVCLFDPQERSIFAGDMVAGVGTVLIDPTDGDMAIYLDSLRRLAGLDPVWIHPGHGPTLEDGREVIEELLRHRLWREERVFDALEAGPTDLLAITAAAYAELSVMLWPLASRSAEAHLRKLEREGRARRSSEGWTITESRR